VTSLLTVKASSLPQISVLLDVESIPSAHASSHSPVLVVHSGRPSIFSSVLVAIVASMLSSFMHWSAASHVSRTPTHRIIVPPDLAVVHHSWSPAESNLALALLNGRDVVEVLGNSLGIVVGPSVDEFRVLVRHIVVSLASIMHAPWIWKSLVSLMVGHVVGATAVLRGPLISRWKSSYVVVSCLEGRLGMEVVGVG